MKAYFELPTLYHRLWVEPINIGTLVVKRLIFVDKSLALIETCIDTKFHVYGYYGY